MERKGGKYRLYAAGRAQKVAGDALGGAYGEPSGVFSFLIYLSKAAWAQKLVTGWSFSWRAASRFVAGEKAEDAIRVIRVLNEKGINATLDHLGEHTSKAEEAANTTENILAILDEIDKAKVRANVSIKLTQIGMGLDERTCHQNLIRILERARENNNFVRIDVEDTPYTDITISTYHAMLERGFTTQVVGMAVQSYLYRAEADVRALLDARPTTAHRKAC